MSLVLGGCMKARCRQPELMDQPGLDEHSHLQALRGLRRVNLVSGTVRFLWKRIKLLAEVNSARPIRVLDLACGGGDIAIGLAEAARRAKRQVTVDGWDFSPTAVASATTTVERKGLANVQFHVRNVLSDPLPHDYDAVVCTLFLHHLEEGDAVAVLRKMKESTRRLVLVDDLRRSRTGYVLAWLGCRIFSRSAIVHTDGPRSVRGAFTMKEIAELARSAGLEGATLVRRWPQRFLLSWTKP